MECSQNGFPEHYLSWVLDLLSETQIILITKGLAAVEHSVSSCV